jgi:ferredoxin--NADP+ reductase
MKLRQYDISKHFSGKVVSNVCITQKSQAEEVRHIVLETEGGDFRFEVGQSVGVLVPGPHEFGNEDHLRLYSIAGAEEGEGGGQRQIALTVRRCSYIDDVSGERHKGIASNYLCDRQPGDVIRLAGPFGPAFEVPEDKTSNLIMIGLGTGIAPFRAFVKRIYKTAGGWQGKVRLFYGARSGLEMLYMNDEKDDFANYYDKDTFRAFQAVSPKPHLDAPIALDRTLDQSATEIWELLLQANTYVFVSGQEKVRDILDQTLSKIAGSPEQWARRKAELVAGKRWVELLY